LVISAVGFGGGYLLATRVLFPAPPPPGDFYEVPDLHGLGLAAATERLEGAGLRLGAVDSLRHPTVPAGMIVGQSPLPGQLLGLEGPVRVTVSVGPERRLVPDVTRLARDRARTLLEATGFVVVVDTVESEVPRGRVVSVDPEPETEVALPAEVRLEVSTGPPQVAMPLVLGFTREEAVSLLESMGLTVAEVEEVFRFGRDQGIVVEQEPAAETLLERGSAVRLAVGKKGG